MISELSVPDDLREMAIGHIKKQLELGLLIVKHGGSQGMSTKVYVHAAQLAYLLGISMVEISNNKDVSR